MDKRAFYTVIYNTSRILLLFPHTRAYLARVRARERASAHRGNGRFRTSDIRHATGLTGKAAFQAAVSTGETLVVPASAAKMAAFAYKLVVGSW